MRDLQEILAVFDADGDGGVNKAELVAAAKTRAHRSPVWLFTASRVVSRQ